MSDQEIVPKQSIVVTFCRSLWCERIKLLLATCVVSVLLLVVVIGIAKGYCVLQVFPLINFIILFVCLVVLATVEGLHYAVVSVEKWDMEQYRERFPRALRCHALVNTPEKVKKFLVGRQFFTIFVVFLLAQVTSFPGIPHNFAGLPKLMIIILLQTGLPGIAMTLTVGQLISQIYVEEFTLQFLNFFFCEVMIRCSLGAEWIGVCNFSWLLYGIASRLVCRKVRRAQKVIDSQKMTTVVTNNDSNSEPMSPTEMNRSPDYKSGIPTGHNLSWFDYLKYLWSTCATLGALGVVVYGISQRVYVLPVPEVAAFLIAICMMSVLFYLEGLMIAIVGTQYWDPETFREVYPRAYQINRLMSQPENVKRFIIGRQFFTVLTNFMLAQIFTFAYWKAGSINPVLFFILIKSGLVGVLNILSFGQLLPELLAAEYPLRFMNMWGSVTIVYVSLLFDYIGVGHCAWTVYYLTRPFCCKAHMVAGKAATDTKQSLVRVTSAEVLAVTQERNPVQVVGIQV